MTGNKIIDLGSNLPQRPILRYVDTNTFGMNFENSEIPTRVPIYQGLRDSDVAHLDKLTSDEKEDLITVIEHPSLLLGSAYTMLSENGKLKDCVDKIDRPWASHVINRIKMLASMNEDDARRLLVLSKKARKSYVRTVTDAIENPTNYPAPSLEDSEITLRDVIINNTKNYLNIAAREQ